MKKLFTILLVSLMCTFLFAAGQEETGTTVGIAKLLSHPALDNVEKGAVDYLSSSDLDINFNLQNANGDTSTAVSIANEFKTSKVDLALGIATPTAQSLVNTFDDVPVVFAAVTDPVDAALVSVWGEDESSNVCGVSDMTPVADQIKLLCEVTDAKSIGFVYSSGEANSIAVKKDVQDICDTLGVELVEVSVANTAEVKQAAQTIAPRVDAIYLSTDNNVASAAQALVEVCEQNNIGLLGADPSAIEGLDYLIAWGFDYYKIGLKTGQMIEEILKGANPGSLGAIILTDPKDFELRINLDVAKKLGIEISDELLSSASHIIEGGIVKEL